MSGTSTKGEPNMFVNIVLINVHAVRFALDTKYVGEEKIEGVILANIIS